MIALILVAFSLGLSNLAAPIGIGIGIAGASARTRLRVGVVFGPFETGRRWPRCWSRPLPGPGCRRSTWVG